MRAMMIRPIRRRRPKIAKILLRKSAGFEMEKFEMRVAPVICIGSLVAFAVLTMPALAKDTAAQRTDEKQTSAACHAYEQAPDGSWRVLACEEVGGNGQTQHRSPARSREEDPR